MSTVYKHGTYGEFSPSIGAVPVESGSVAVYIGTAPVNLVRGYADKGLVNAPIKISSLSDAQNNLGYSSDWETFTLSEVVKVHFDNSIGNVGPVVFINVLDPDLYQAEDAVTTSLTFVNGQAFIVSNKIILDTLAIVGKTEGTDYEVSYDYDLERVVITSETITEAVEATYNEIDASGIDKSDIIGKTTEYGEFEGLGAVALIYTSFNLVPNILAAPGWSHDKDVYAALIKASKSINGHWDAIVNADIPVTTGTLDTISAAIQWKKQNGYTSERAKVYWPLWKGDDGNIYHLSTLASWKMMQVDSENYDVPMESVSNKQIPYGRQYFGEGSRNRGFDQNTGNELNKNGITTAAYWGGINVLWGPHTAAFEHGAEDIDNRSIFENSIRMMMHVTNSFQKEWGLTIDEPMTLALAETIKNREQEKIDSLKAMGALIGDPVVEFIETDNPIENLVNGDFIWASRLTPTPPFKSGTMRVAYTTEGFNAYYGGEE